MIFINCVCTNIFINSLELEEMVVCEEPEAEQLVQLELHALLENSNLNNNN